MMLKTILDQHDDLRKFLFIRGFLVTNDPAIPEDGFPFYGNWKCNRLGGMYFWVHPMTGFHTASEKGIIAFLLGHAYNPFTMEVDESKILKRLVSNFGTSAFHTCVNELTGIFVLGILEEGKLTYLVDPSGLQSACSGLVNGTFYLSSHPQMVADICGLEMDPFVARLNRYKWYPRVLGAYLPADLTPFSELKRIVPDHEYTFAESEASIRHKRFYPVKDLAECSSDEEYRQVIVSAAEILRNNMELVLKKWENPWLSLSGGIDSNTAFAAANGHYDELKTFSFYSVKKETIDCDAAKKIAERFKVLWTYYEIPQDPDQLDRYAEKVEIIRHNNGYIAHEKDNELRKRVYLEASCPADIEIKNWASETIRGYWYKHFGRKTMPPLSGKLFRNLYKIFVLNRKLAHEIDTLFERFIEEYEYRGVCAQYPPADLHYHEVGWGSWGGLNISEMKFCYDVTSIYNNRNFMDLLFKVPLEKRIADTHHLDMKQYLNRELYDMHIRVVNMKETKFRAFALNVIFTLNSILPF